MLKDVLKSRRNELKLKQAEIAEYVKVTPQTYLKWENGAYEPKANQIKKLAEILKVTEIEICRGYLFEEPDRYDILNFIQEVDSNREWIQETTFMAILYKYIYEKRKFIKELEKEADKTLQRFASKSNE